MSIPQKNQGSASGKFTYKSQLNFQYKNKNEWIKILEEIKGKGYNLSQVRDYVEKTRGVKYSYKGVWNILRRWLKVSYGKPYVLIGKQSETASEELKKNQI